MICKVFIEKIFKVGIGLFFFLLVLFEFCNCYDLEFFDLFEVFEGKVIIVGVGVVGFVVGYFFQWYNIDFEIIEVVFVWGGRMKKIVEFVDFFIDFGVEWIYIYFVILLDIFSSFDIDVDIDIIVYNL